MPNPSQGEPWLSPQQAATHLGCSVDEPICLAADGRLPVHRLPDGSPVISPPDLVPLPTPVRSSEGIDLLNNQIPTENTMQQTQDASVALLAPIQDAVPADANNEPEMGADPSNQIESQIVSTPKISRSGVKYAPPDFQQNGDVIVGFRSTDDAQVSKRIMDCVSMLRGWGRLALASQKPRDHMSSKVA
jgi:hypothetical protein